MLVTSKNRKERSIKKQINAFKKGRRQIFGKYDVKRLIKI